MGFTSPPYFPQRLLAGSERSEPVLWVHTHTVQHLRLLATHRLSHPLHCLPSRLASNRLSDSSRATRAPISQCFFSIHLLVSLIFPITGPQILPETGLQKRKSATATPNTQWLFIWESGTPNALRQVGLLLSPPVNTWTCVESLLWQPV